MLERSGKPRDNRRMTKPKRPRDTNQLAKLIVGISTGETTDESPDAGKDPKAIARGRQGGLKGGHTRAAKLTPEELSRIGKAGADARWGRNKT